MTPPKRNLLVLTGLLAALLLVFLFYHSAEKKRLSAENIHDFFWADSNLVDSIAVKYGTWTYLHRREGQWLMAVDPTLTYPAGRTDISTIIRTTNEMVLTDLISANPAKQDKFNVDTLRGTVIRFFGGGRPLADFILGRIGQDFTHTYVRREGSDSVFLASGRFTEIYAKAPMQWMDRRVFPFAPEHLREIRWKHPQTETRMTRAVDGKLMVSRDPEFDPVPADSSAAAYKFSYVGALQFNSFLPLGREQEALFDKPALALSAIDDAGKAYELLITADTGASNRFYAMYPGRPRPVGIFFKSHYDRLNGEYDSLRAGKE